MSHYVSCRSFMTYLCELPWNISSFVGSSHTSRRRVCDFFTLVCGASGGSGSLPPGDTRVSPHGEAASPAGRRVLCLADGPSRVGLSRV